MKRTTTVNIRQEPYDAYIGRGTVFGNPFRISKNRTREDVIGLYREWFRKRLEQPWFRERVLRLRGLRLGCYCKPLPCHGDVIVEYLEVQDV